MARSAMTPRIVLPLSQAFRIAWLSLRVRWQRSLVVASSLIFSIAFFAYLYTKQSLLAGGLEGAQGIRAQLFSGDGVTGASTRDLWLLMMSLLICLVGITNAQLMAVTERFREIGTFKCLGALDRFVVTILLLESCYYGVGGGIAGSSLGTLTAWAVVTMGGGSECTLGAPSFVLTIESVILSVIISVVLSVLGVVYPAFMAAKMAPYLALRREY